MTGSLTDAAENRVIDAIHGTATYVAPTLPLKMRLMTTAGTDSTAGTQVTGGSYVAQTHVATTAAAGACANTATIRFDGLPAATIVGYEIWDSAGTPRREYHSTFTSPYVVAAGYSLEFAAGAVTFTLD